MNATNKASFSNSLHFGQPDANGVRELMMHDMPLGMTAHPLRQESLADAARECAEDFEERRKNTFDCHLPKVHPIKLTPAMKRNVLLGILGTSKKEASRFIECQYTLNILLRACASLYDEMVALYDPLTDPSFKQAVKNAEKAVTRLLNACGDALHLEEDRTTFVNDSGRTKDDECQWTFQQCADWLTDRVRMLITYGMVMNADEWRLNELDTKLNDVIPDEYVDRCQEAMYKSIRDLALGITPSKR